MLEEDRRGRNRRDPRVENALEKVEEAQRLLDKAAQDLCSVDGYAAEWKATCELYQKVKEHWHEVDARRGELARSRLELVEDGGGPRYLLAGRPVHAGDVLEFDDGDGWLAARFEWTHRLDDLPELHLRDGSKRSLPSDCLFRWPRSE